MGGFVAGGHVRVDGCSERDGDWRWLDIANGFIKSLSQQQQKFGPNIRFS
jgi:hypothetical protein